MFVTKGTDGKYYTRLTSEQSKFIEYIDKTVAIYVPVKSMEKCGCKDGIYQFRDITLPYIYVGKVKDFEVHLGGFGFRFDDLFTFNVNKSEWDYDKNEFHPLHEDSKVKLLSEEGKLELNRIIEMIHENYSDDNYHELFEVLPELMKIIENYI